MTSMALLSHGSPDLRSATAARDLSLAVGRRVPGLDVAAAFLQHNRPSLADTCRELTALGNGTVVVVPMLLAAAYHARVDVPAALARAQQVSAGRIALAAPLGIDPALLDALDSRTTPGPVVLAAAATSQETARCEIHDLAAIWSRRRGAPVEVAFVSLSTPSIATTAIGLANCTGHRVSVASFLLYPGRLHDHVVAQAGGRVVSAPLFDAPEVVDLALARARQALESSRPDAGVRGGSGQRTSNIA